MHTIWSAGSTADSRVASRVVLPVPVAPDTSRFARPSTRPRSTRATTGAMLPPATSSANRKGCRRSTRRLISAPPAATGGALISLRVLRRQPFRLAELVAGGSIAPVVARGLRGLVDGRASLLVSGATGTGKTSLLATLLSAVDPAERIVCIEEARELVADHPHVVHLVARRPNVEGAGEVGLAALVRHALRMRPDRIVLGECRGAEVREVLTALNTGHQGGCATVHANALADLPARLAALGALAGMTPAAVAAQAVSALDAVVHLRRD